MGSVFVAPFRFRYEFEDFSSSCVLVSHFALDEDQVEGKNLEFVEMLEVRWGSATTVTHMLVAQPCIHQPSISRSTRLTT